VISGFGNQKINQSFQGLGLNLPEGVKWGYFACLQNGELKSEWSGHGIFDKNIEIAGKNIVTRTEISEREEGVHMSKICLENCDYSKAMQGLNIVVFDENGAMKDSVAFNVTGEVNSSYSAYRSDCGCFYNLQSE